MLSHHLADLYGVESKALTQAVKARILRSQFVTLRSAWGKHSKYAPYAFTEQGDAMLASVLRSPRAVAVNI